MIELNEVKIDTSVLCVLFRQLGSASDAFVS